MGVVWVAWFGFLGIQMFICALEFDLLCCLGRYDAVDSFGLAFCLQIGHLYTPLYLLGIFIAVGAFGCRFFLLLFLHIFLFNVAVFTSFILYCLFFYNLNSLQGKVANNVTTRRPHAHIYTHTHKYDWTSRRPEHGDLATPRAPKERSLLIHLIGTPRTFSIASCIIRTNERCNGFQLPSIHPSIHLFTNTPIVVDMYNPQSRRPKPFENLEKRNTEKSPPII